MMVMFWLSVILAILIGGCSLIGSANEFGLQLIGLVLAGNAYVRLQRGKPVRNNVNFAATVLALLMSGMGSLSARIV